MKDVNMFNDQDMKDFDAGFIPHAGSIGIEIPPQEGDWECYLFGCYPKPDIVFVPKRGRQPNWFHRQMQRLILGNRWVKKGRK